METEVRENCLNKLNELLENEEISAKIEGSIYQYVIDVICIPKNLQPNWDNFYFKRGYMNKCISIYSNLNKNSYVGNKDLIDRIISGKIDASRIAFLSPQELFPENWNEFLDKKKAEDEFFYTKKMESYTDEFKCGRCKMSKCTIYQVQLRSADEPSTSMLQCINCHHKWSF